MKQGMATTTVEDSPSKVSVKKKQRDKSGSGSSVKGSLSSPLFGGNSSNNTSGGIGRMDVSELPSFQQNDRSSSSSSSDEKVAHFVSGLKNHSVCSGLDLGNSGSTKSSGKRKSGSESSNGSGGQSLMMTNSAPHPEGGGRRGLGGVRGFSSGSSDGEEEREQAKHGASRKTHSVKPAKQSASGAAASSVESDDEATDSADEGNSGEEEQSGSRRRRDGEIAGALRQSDRLMTRKDSSESTNSATSPVLTAPRTNSTIFVESALPKEPLIGPNSPVNMSVGYGAAAAESMPPPSAVFDETPSRTPPGTPTLDSPKLASDGPQSPGTPIPLSPPTETTEGPLSAIALPSSSGGVVTLPPTGVSLNPVQPSPSLQGPSFNLPFENWVYQAQAAAVYSPFPLSSSHPGSVATTPVAVESGSYLRTGAPVFLRGTVCQESEGVLIVSVQWRNKTFSGSLIDMNQHEWAPPRLAGGFDEPLAHLRDLCKQQEKRESESQQVNVDVEGDDSAKDTTEKMDSSTKEEDTCGASSDVGLTGGKGEGKSGVRGHVEKESRMETDEVSMSPPKFPRNRSLESEPGDMEIVEESASSNSRSRNQSPISVSPRPKSRGGVAKVSVDSVYSDISDASDSEERGRREGSGQSSQVFVASDPPQLQTVPRGSRPKKIAAEEIQHTLPPFSAINSSSPLPSSSQEPSERKHDGRMKPRAGGEKDASSVELSSAAILLRSNLLSSYPSTPTTGSTTVSTPNQNHRHSFVGNSHPAGVVSGGPVVNSSLIHGQGATGMDFAKGHHPESAAKSTGKPSNFSIESLNARGSSETKEQKLPHSRSSSPHPQLLKPRERRGRSTSPGRSTPTKGDHPPMLPPFNATGVVHQDVTKTTTLDYMPTVPNHAFSKSAGTTADDSDSSGSGSILSTHRKRTSKPHKRRTAELLAGLKDGKDEGSIKAPETPALGPIGIHNFNLKIQPISPGIDYPAQQQHMPSAIPKDGPPPSSTASATSMGSPARSPAARVASPHTTTVGEVMGALLTTPSGGGFREGGIVPLSKSARETDKGDKDSSGKEQPERRHTGTSSSPSSSVSSTSIPGVSLGMPAPTYPLPQGVIQAPPQGLAAMKQHDHFKRRSPVPPEMLRQEQHEHGSRKRKSNTSPNPSSTAATASGVGESGKDHEDPGEPGARGQHPGPHTFPFPQQQGFNTFMGENEKMDFLPADFNYDPNLPMTMQYQLLSFVNQKKQAQLKEYEDQLKETNRKDKEEMERQHSQQLAQFQSQQQQHGRPSKRPRIGEPHLNPGFAPLQLPPPGGTKDHGKQKKPGHHQRHVEHGEERHYGLPVHIKSEPFEIPRPGKQPVGGKQPQPHMGHRTQQQTPASSSSSSSKQGSQQKPIQPQPRATKSDKLVIKTEVGSDAQPPHPPPSAGLAGWPVIPMGMVPPGNYQYSMLQQQQALHALQQQHQQQQQQLHHQQQQQQQQQQQSKEAGKGGKEHNKDGKEPASGSQHTAFHTQPISTPIVAFSAGSQGWATASPFIHAAHPTIMQPGASSHLERTSRQEHSSSAVTTTTSVITGKPASEMHSPSQHRTHRNMGQSSPSSSKKSSAFTPGDGGSERRSGMHKLHASHEHSRQQNSGNHPTNRKMEGSSSSQRSGTYPGQSDGADTSRRSHSHPHSSSSSSSSSTSTTQQSGGHPSSSSRAHKSATDHLASAAQLQVQAAAAHQMSLLQQQQQQSPSLSSPIPGFQLRQGIPVGGLVQPNWEDWARLQEMLQKGQIGGIGSADPWQQQMQQMQMLAQQAQGVPMVPLADPSILIALQQQQQQQQQQQNADQATTAAIQNFQLLQAAANNNMIPMLHPAMAGAHPAMAAAGLYDQTAFGSAAAMLPHFPMAATSQKRD